MEKEIRPVHQTQAPSTSEKHQFCVLIPFFCLFVVSLCPWQWISLKRKNE